MSDIQRRPDVRAEIDLVAALLDMVGIPATAVVEYVDARTERKARRLAAVLNDGAAMSGLTIPELLEAAEQSEETSDLLEDVLRAASRARSAAHVRALARVLKTAMSGGDDARVDDLRMVVDALDGLDPVAVPGLHALHAVPPVAKDEPLPEVRTVLARELGSDALTSPLERSLFNMRLTNPGIEVSNDGATTSSARTIVSPFGRRVLGFLADHPPD